MSRIVTRGYGATVTDVVLRGFGIGAGGTTDVTVGLGALGLGRLGLGLLGLTRRIMRITR